MYMNNINGIISKSPALNIYIEDIALENIRLNRWDYNSLLKPKVVDFQHLKLTDINMDANDFVFKKDLIGLNTELLTFKEKSGFELLGMQGRLLMDQKNMVLKYFELETNQSDINGDIELEYDGFESFYNFHKLYSHYTFHHILPSKGESAGTLAINLPFSPPNVK